MLRENAHRIRWQSATPEFKSLAGFEAQEEPEVDLEKPEDRLVALLEAACEVEHTLLLQYLFMGYGINLGGPGGAIEHVDVVRCWRSTLLAIAREEMGHFMTVQAVLVRFGRQPHLHRDPFPFYSPVLDREFHLRPLHRHSVAGLLFMEIPDLRRMESELRLEICKISEDTGVAILESNRVGALYAKIMLLLRECRHLFGQEDQHWHSGDWGTEQPRHLGCAVERLSPSYILLPEVTTFEQVTRAIAEVADQGEGLEVSPHMTSHFARLLHVYRQMGNEGPLDCGSSTARKRTSVKSSEPWISLLNARYHVLLDYLYIYLQSAGDNDSDRKFISRWSLEEMNYLRVILADKLPVHDLRKQNDALFLPKPAVPARVSWQLFWVKQLDALDAIRQLATNHPELHSDELVQEILKADWQRRRIITGQMLR